MGSLYLLPKVSVVEDRTSTKKGQDMSNTRGFYWSDDYKGVLYCTGGVDQYGDLVYLTPYLEAWFPSIEQALYITDDQAEGYDWHPPKKDSPCEDYGGFKVGDLVKCVERYTNILDEGGLYRVRSLREGCPDIYLETPDNGAFVPLSWHHNRFEAVSFPPEMPVSMERLWVVTPKDSAQKSSCVRYGNLEQVIMDFGGATIKPLQFD